MHELPLVFFTVVAQASIGLTILACLNFLIDADQQKYSRALLISLFLLIASGFGALFHLGQPFRAFNVIFGIGRSPMSNEILATGIYGGLLFVTFVLAYFHMISKSLLKLVSVLTSLSALILLILIPMVYTIETISQWFNSYTNLQMYVTSLALGGVIALIIYPSKWMTVVTILGVISSVLFFPSYFIHLLNADIPELLDKNRYLWSAKILLVMISIALLVILYNSKQKHIILALSATFVIFIAEIFGRISFYNLWLTPM